MGHAWNCPELRSTVMGFRGENSPKPALPSPEAYRLDADAATFRPDQLEAVLLFRHRDANGEDQEPSDSKQV